MGRGAGRGDAEDSQRDWRFLIDENLDPAIVSELERYDLESAYGVEAIIEGADDFEDVLPHCRETGAVLVTNNVHDFNATDLPADAHAGIVVVHDKTRPAVEIAKELRRIATAYPSREAFRGFESAEDWRDG